MELFESVAKSLCRHQLLLHLVKISLGFAQILLSGPAVLLESFPRLDELGAHRPEIRNRQHGSVGRWCGRLGQGCGGASAGWTVSGTAIPGGYTATILNTTAKPFDYWNAPTLQFQSTCPATDGGAQRLWLQVSSNDGRAVETVQLVKRKP